MKQFFKFLFASLLGTLAAMFIFIVGFFFFIAIIASSISTEDVVSISKNTILEIQLNYSVPERSSYRPSEGFGSIFPEIVREVGMNDILKSILNAKYDPDISGVYLNLNNLYVGSYSKISSIRKALEDFQTSGKFVYAHGNRISQRAYYLASVADSIYLTPTGTLDLRGLAMELTFFKKTVDKLEIEPQIFQAGKYKGAVEQYLNEKMSPANEEQLDKLLQSIYNKVVDEISADRNLDVSELKSFINNYSAAVNAENVSFGLIDGIKYFDEVVDMMKEKIGKSSSERLNKIDLLKYISVPSSTDEYSRNRIAVIYAVGEIYESNGGDNTIGIKNITNELRKARQNKNVKAVVLRIDSPGGSPLTSELIAREVELTSNVKPVVASFATVAASGGYYIATDATEIYSEPFSITGSIGAYGIVPNFEDFFDNKLGITFDRVESSKYASMYSLAKPLTIEEKKFIQLKIDEIYATFVHRVASGRDMSQDYVEGIAQGRVWSGLQAEEVGLVDKLGSLEDAVERAADLAGIETYRVVEYPAIKEPLERLVDFLSARANSILFDPEDLSLEQIIYNARRFIIEDGIYTRLPVDIIIN